MERWAGRTALVTGASSGIGRCIAIDLLKNGVNVVACARRIDKVESIRQDVGDGVGKFLPLKCDVSKEAEILDMFEKIKSSDFKGVDICINNAGLGDIGKLTEGSTEIWNNMLLVNVLGLSICTREALKSMKERGVDDGHILHISSVASHEVYSIVPFYSATKHAVWALTEGLRQELSEKKSLIRVTQIAPGATKSEFMTAAGASQETIDNYMQTLPLLEAEDVSATVIYALSTPKHVQVLDLVVYPIHKEKS